MTKSVVAADDHNMQNNNDDDINDDNDDDNDSTISIVVFPPGGPIGLQLEEVNVEEEEPSTSSTSSSFSKATVRVVRWIDGGPHCPGQARASGRIHPGDGILQVQILDGDSTTSTTTSTTTSLTVMATATTYPEMLQVLQDYPQATRTFTVQSLAKCLLRTNTNKKTKITPIPTPKIYSRETNGSAVGGEEEELLAATTATVTGTTTTVGTGNPEQLQTATLVVAAAAAKSSAVFSPGSEDVQGGGGGGKDFHGNKQQGQNNNNDDDRANPGEGILENDNDKDNDPHDLHVSSTFHHDQSNNNDDEINNNNNNNPKQTMDSTAMNHPPTTGVVEPSSHEEGPKRSLDSTLITVVGSRDRGGDTGHTSTTTTTMKTTTTTTSTNPPGPDIHHDPHSLWLHQQWRYYLADGRLFPELGTRPTSSSPTTHPQLSSSLLIVPPHQQVYGRTSTMTNITNNTTCMPKQPSFGTKLEDMGTLQFEPWSIQEIAIRSISSSSFSSFSVSMRRNMEEDHDDSQKRPTTIHGWELGMLERRRRRRRKTRDDEVDRCIMVPKELTFSKPSTVPFHHVLREVVGVGEERVTILSNPLDTDENFRSCKDGLEEGA